MSEKKIQPKKTEAVKELVDQFSGTRDFFFTDYRGLTVGQITDIRNRLREQKAEFHVVKNNYAKIAFDEIKHGEVKDMLVGPTAIAYSKEEAGPVAKAILDFSKDAPLELKGGLVEGSLFDKEQVLAFSKLPTKTELLQMLMGTMNAPLQNMVYALNGVTTKLVRTLAAVAEKKGQE
jgi:large subunit ribosomal protein L10